jgi:hypothetical protein
MIMNVLGTIALVFYSFPYLGIIFVPMFFFVRSYAFAGISFESSLTIIAPSHRSFSSCCCSTTSVSISLMRLVLQPRRLT